MLAEDDQPRREKPSRFATLAFVAAGDEYRDLAGLSWSHARVDRSKVEACSVSRHHAHAVPAYANQEVCARPQDVLQAWRLGVEAIADRQVASCKREPAESFAAFRSGQLRVGETGRRPIERRMEAPGRAVVAGSGDACPVDNPQPQGWQHFRRCRPLRQQSASNIPQPVSCSSQSASKRDIGELSDAGGPGPGRCRTEAKRTRAMSQRQPE